MSCWQPQWLRAVAPARRDLWRGVEAQHRVATMRLVDDLQEQDLLESVLEASKPPLPAGGSGAHYLLFTPFRYVSPWPSRFRRAGEPGAWYGADAPRTVAAELGWWRWRFFLDSEGLADTQLVTEHTFFQARFGGLELDLNQPPWARERATWRDPDDHQPCQALATEARALEPPVQAIRYESARLEAGLCEVVLDVHVLAMPKRSLQQTWVCKVTRSRVLWSHEAERMQFDMG